MSQDSVVDSWNCSEANGTGINRVFYNLSETHGAALVLHSGFILIVIVASLLANGLVIFLVAKEKRLRYRSILASLSIVVSDILFTIFYQVPAFANVVAKGWVFGDNALESCRVFAIVETYLIYVRWIAIGSIAMDKFLTVRFPFRYMDHSKSLLVLLTLVIWALPACLVVPNTIPSFSDVSFRPNLPACLPSCDLPFSLCAIVLTMVVSLTLFWGAFLPSLFYTWMYWKGRKLKAVTHLGRLAVRMTTGTVVEQPIAVLEKHTQERRALLTLFLLYITVLVTNLPIYIITLVRRTNRCKFFSIPIYVQFGFSGLFLLSTVLDPLVLMRNQDFRQALRKLFHCKSNASVNPAPQTNPLTADTRADSIENAYLGNSDNNIISETKSSV